MSVRLPRIIDDYIVSRAITFQNHSSPHSLTPLQLKTASNDKITKPKQVLIKVEAVAWNPLDALLKEFIPKRFIGSRSVKVAGSDFSGTVIELGSEIKSDLKVGDKVFGSFSSPMTRNNAFQEYILQDYNNFSVLSKVPDGLPIEQAAGLSTISATAYTGLSDVPNLKGANILILGAGSSVGLMAVQLSKYFGVKTVAATCSPRSAELAKQAGASDLIDYTKGSASEIKETLEIVKKNGKFDFIFDSIRDDTLHGHLSQILKTRKEGGKLIIITGAFAHRDGKPRYSDMLPTFRFARTLGRYTVGLSNYDIKVFQMGKLDGYENAINTLYKKGNLKVPIDSIYNFYTQYEEAYEKVANNRAKGKVIMLLKEEQKKSAS